MPTVNPNLLQFAQLVCDFQNDSLRYTISKIEKELVKSDNISSSVIIQSKGIDSTLLNAALEIKKVAGQVNTIIHAVGISLLLPKILDKGETVKSLSLGAGNSGRKFDMETDKTVAEFKFITWKGADVVRQDGLFKDFYRLAEYQTDKRKRLYVTGLDYPLKFFRENRSIKTVLKKELGDQFSSKYHFTKVSEYFNYMKTEVELVDIWGIIPDFKRYAANAASVNFESNE